MYIILELRLYGELQNDINPTVEINEPKLRLKFILILV